MMKRITLAFMVMCAMSESYAQSVNYDLNGDGKEDVSDITCLMDHLLKKQDVVDNHEYVDLGLTVKWATCNVGASKPEETGLYFAWGETTGYSNNHDFSWAKYKWGTSSTTLTKYCINSKYGTVDSRTTLEMSDDAANVNWGVAWHTPTPNEWKELSTDCTWTWTDQNGVSGYLVASKTNGNSIFLPAAGYYYGTTLKCYTTDEYCCYWSNQIYSSEYSFRAYNMSGNGQKRGTECYDDRCLGLTIRAVRY